MNKRSSEWRRRFLEAVAVAVLGWSGSAAAQARSATEQGATDAYEDTTSEAADPKKEACLNAFGQAQLERGAHRLRAAQQALLQCAIPRCGTPLFQQCTHMYEEIDRALPSVVFTARDARSNVTLKEVAVELGADQLTSRMDGKSVVLDPGEHEFVFRASGYEPLKVRVLLRAGDKYHAVAAQLERKGAVSGVVEADATGLPVGTYVLGGLGIVSLGAFGILRMSGRSDFDELKRRCGAVGCAESEISKVENKFALSHVALGVGAAAAVGALLWTLLGSDSTSPPASAAFVLEPAASGHGLSAVGRGRF